MERLEALLDHQSPQVRLRAAELVLRPLSMPHVTVHDAREGPLDEHDFESFVRCFTGRTSGSQPANELSQTAQARTAIETYR